MLSVVSRYAHASSPFYKWNGQLPWQLLFAPKCVREAGDFKAAVPLACCEDSIADRSDATFTALKEKHPPPHPDSSIPSPPGRSVPLLTVSVEDVDQAIKSFTNGSAGGPDGLRPQHLKDMTNSSNVEASSLLTALASFPPWSLNGNPPPSHPPISIWSHPCCPEQERRWGKAQCYT